MSTTSTTSPNGTADLRVPGAGERVTDEKMDQIRELLFGDFAKQNEVRIAALETRVREIEWAVQQQLEALERRLEAMGREVGAEQNKSFEEIARGVMELGEHIKRIRSK